MKAVCHIKEIGDSGVSGIVRFKQNPSGSVTVEADVKGLSDGKHGIHINEFGSLKEGVSHYNPHMREHGGPTDFNRHAGDLGNLETKQGETSTLILENDQIKLTGQFNVIGRSVVIHQEEDDLGKGDNQYSKLTGNSGSRVAWGVIGYSS